MRIISTHDIPGRFNLAIIVSRHNQEVGEQLYNGALARCRELGFQEAQITVVWAPGVTEIPIIAQRLAKAGKSHAIVALGSIIRGETKHYDWLCEQVRKDCQRVSMNHGVAVIFGVVTAENQAQALQRAEGSKGHKGRDAIDEAFEMVSLLSQI